MIASGEFLTARPGTREKAELGAGIENTSVQIAGSHKTDSRFESFDLISWWVVNLVFYLDETPIQFSQL